MVPAALQEDEKTESHTTSAIVDSEEVKIERQKSLLRRPR